MLVCKGYLTLKYNRVLPTFSNTVPMKKTHKNLDRVETHLPSSSQGHSNK